MKILITLVVLLFFGIGMAVSGGQDMSQSDHHRSHVTAVAKAEPRTDTNSAVLTAFEKLKGLAGEWEARDGVSYGGKPIRISYKIVSNGTGVMETYTQVGVDVIEMVSVYHLDGDKLMMMHFCAVNNQVRLRAEPMLKGGRELHFSYVDASNLSVSNQEVMNNLVITFQDRDHFTQTWTWRMTNDKGKTSDGKAVYNFVRRK